MPQLSLPYFVFIVDNDLFNSSLALRENIDEQMIIKKY